MLARLSSRWSLILAVIFCGYSLLLLGQTFHSRAQLKAAADARLIADNKRRAAALGTLAAERRSEAVQLAALHELDTYLINKALGMSMRYGLNANLDALEQRFRQYVAEAGAREGSPLRRIVFVDDGGSTLADTAPGGGPLPEHMRRSPSVALAADIDANRMLASAPVFHRGDYSGTVVVVSDLAQFYGSLLQLELAGTYHENLITADGRLVAPSNGRVQFSDDAAARLARLADNDVMPIAELQGRDGGSVMRDVVVVKSPVAELPLFLVTTIARQEVYGDIASSLFLYSAALIPIAVLLVAIKLDRLQRRTLHLEAAALSSDSQRRELQGQYDDLRLEILRREAVERELERHRANLESLVAQRTSELNSLFHALPDLYFRMRRDGTIVDYRAGRDDDLYDMPESFLGRKMQDVLPPEIGAQFDMALQEIARGIPHRVFEYGLPVHGETQYYEARVLPLETDQVVAVIRNITDRRMVEEVREAHRLEAERLARVKSEFLANMSHEIRTPLNGVLGMARIGFRESYGREKARASFEKILQSGKLLLGVVNDVLDFSKIEAGKLVLENVPLSLERVLDHVRGLFEERAAAKSIGLSVSRDDNVPVRCMGDPLRIEQILINLLSNAVKFTQRGVVSLRVTRAAQALVFTVADTGIGMSEEQIGRLFTPFEQGDGSTTRRFGGTGLGLAIVGRLVDLMGGSIRVESRPAVGSTLEITLPLVDVPDSVAQTPAATDEYGVPTGEQRLAGMSILAAEDADINRMVLEEFLVAEGATVTMVADGRQAVERVQRDGGAAFDIVLMDVQMPEMDGYEATRRIREIAPELPIVGQTAHAMAEDREKCLACGMVGHIAKPLEIEELVGAVMRHARARPGAAVAHAQPSEAVVAARPEPLVPGAETFVIDWPALVRRFRGKQHFIDRLVRVLLESHVDTPAQMRRIIEARDFDSLAFLAHKLKGVVANLDLPQFQQRMATLEAAARAREAGAFDLAEQSLAAIERLIDQAGQYGAGSPPASDAAAARRTVHQND